MTNRNEHSTEKNVYENLQPYQNELFQLTELAGINVNPLLIWIFVQLLNMKIPPELVYKLLKLIKRSAKSTRSKRGMSSRAKLS